MVGLKLHFTVKHICVTLYMYIEFSAEPSNHTENEMCIVYRRVNLKIEKGGSKPIIQF